MNRRIGINPNKRQRGRTIREGCDPRSQIGGSLNQVIRSGIATDQAESGSVKPGQAVFRKKRLFIFYEIRERLRGGL
jgi:hypothetical protein